MKTVILICALLLVLTYKTFAANNVLSFATEMLARPTDKSVTVCLYTKNDVNVYYEFSKDSLNFNRKTQVQTVMANTQYRFILDSLEPNQGYFYRAQYKLSGSQTYQKGTVHKFHTKRAKGAGFNFTIEADPHLYDKKGSTNLMYIALKNQLNNNPDFMIDLGDTFGDDHTASTITYNEVDDLHKNYLPVLGSVCHSLPFFFCIGNHEGEFGYYILQTPPNNLGIYGTLARKRYYANPIPDGFYTGNSVSEGYGMGLPENYYAWEWGDALFVVLDAYRAVTINEKPRGWEWTLGETQYNWFKQTLENSSAKYKFVFTHHILGQTRGGVVVSNNYEWGGYENNNTKWGFSTNRANWELPLHQLMVKNKVNIFFQGHDHIYAKEERDGLVYQTVPMPSDSTYIIGMTDNGDAFTGIKLDGSGHLNVTVNDDKVTVDYISSCLPKDESLRKNGSTVYSYNVTSTLAVSTSGLNKKNIGFELGQNYPNPFNPSTKIRFSVPEAGYVTLKVFDILGKEVTSLVEGYMQSGTYSVDFTADKINASEVYFYRLKQAENIITKKAIFLK